MCPPVAGLAADGGVHVVAEDVHRLVGAGRHALQLLAGYPQAVAQVLCALAGLAADVTGKGAVCGGRMRG